MVIATNYGELDRFGPASALPPILSGHNAPADRSVVLVSVTVAVVSGEQAKTAVTVFQSCRTVTLLDNGVDADNKKQDQPIALCRNLIGFSASWQRFRHLD